MSRLPAVAVLLFAVATSAAPVPKETPAQALARIYGEPTKPSYPVDAKSYVIGEMGKDGLLRMTVPKGHPSRDLPHCDGICPQFAREIEGDFLVIVRVTLKLAKSVERAEDASNGWDTAVGAGLSLCDGKSALPITTFVQGATYENDQWKGWFQFHHGLPNESNTSASVGELKSAGLPLYLKLTRKGKAVSYQVGRDGKEWTAVNEIVCKDELPKKLKVGPVSFKTIDAESIVEFDHYDIQPLKSDVDKR